MKAEQIEALTLKKIPVGYKQDIENRAGIHSLLH